MGRTLITFLGGLLALLTVRHPTSTEAPGHRPALSAGGRVPAAGAAASDSRPAAAPSSRPASRPVRPGVDQQVRERESMIQQQLVSRGIRDSLVLSAMRGVPRHLFVPEDLVDDAYRDGPLPIGHDQTISQPYIVAFMTEALGLKGGENVLEVGTGSGYQAAVLAEIVEDVYTIEILEPLAREATARLERLHYGNVYTRVGDGYRGWPEKAPFDAVIVTAAPDHIPPVLVEQLKVGGRMVIPVGDAYQELILVTKTSTGVERKSILPVRFVPMTGEAEQH